MLWIDSYPELLAHFLKVSPFKSLGSKACDDRQVLFDGVYLVEYEVSHLVWSL